MKTTFALTAAVAATAVLLAGLAGAEVKEVSGVSAVDMPLDTRSVFAERDAGDQALDSRSHTMAWSPPRKLSTKKIVGTVFLMR